MEYKIIVLDLDGTLTNRDKVVTPRTKEALMKAQAMGKIVVLASGRPTPGVIPLARELKLREHGGYIVSFNGGMIVSCKTGETVFSSQLPVEINEKVMDLAAEYRVDIMTYEGDKIIASNASYQYIALESRVCHMEVKEISQVEDMKKYDGKTVCFKGLVAVDKKLKPNVIVVGRHIMTCCEADIAYSGLVVKHASTLPLKTRDWVTLTGRISIEYNEIYGQEGPVIIASALDYDNPPEQELATFY